MASWITVSRTPTSEFDALQNILEPEVYREHIETSNEIAAATSLDTLCARPDIVECNLRGVLLHMIEETARYAGHAGIIRETLDGSRGIRGRDLVLDQVRRDAGPRQAGMRQAHRVVGEARRRRRQP